MENGDVEAYEQNNEQSRDDVTISIEEKLQRMPSRVGECCIFRVPKRLFNMNPIAYEPQVISIGPFHHHKDDLKATEEFKLCSFHRYLSSIDMSLEGIVEKARSWNTQARQFYSKPILMNDEEFVEMMLFDGCFLVEFMTVNYYHIFPETSKMGHNNFPHTEKIMNFSFYESIYSDIISDLTMLENQLPFFVLEALFDVLVPTTSSNNNFPCFEDIVHVFLNSLVLRQPPYNDIPKNDNKPRHLVELLSLYYAPLNSDESCEGQDICHPPTVTELHEAGVSLKKEEEEVGNIVNISFKDGVLKIPPFEIDDAFESRIRNLVAFEQFKVKNRYAIQYIDFLDELISSEEDASLLVKKGILINSIGGSHKEISKLFNDFCKNVTVDVDSHYNSISEDLKRHCQARRNRWMASLKRNYLNSPWALISFLAATILIILTLLQTIFSGLSIH